ncbi:MULTISPECIES: transposase [Aphanothece]|uniref:transposase n=1 Tax=Aphanothece TaxID=1121 RepID=UPI003984860A
MTNLTKTRRRFTAQQKAEAVELCLQECLSCNVVAQRLGHPSSSLARWFVRPALIAARPAPATRACSAARSALSSTGSARRTGNSGGRRIFSGWRQRTLPKSSCRREVSPDRSAR